MPNVLLFIPLTRIIWIIQVIIAAAFILSGFVKLMRDREDIVAGTDWAGGFTAGEIKKIGAAELCCGLLTVAPKLLGFSSYITITTAFAFPFILFALLMCIKRKERGLMYMTLFVLILVVFLNWLTLPVNH